MHHNQMYELCKGHLYRYVLVQTTDQQTFDGIVENVDEMNLYLAVPTGEPIEVEERNENRLLGGLGYGYPGYGYSPYGLGYGLSGYSYPYYPRPRRRFQRLVLPLAALTALTLLPYY